VADNSRCRHNLAGTMRRANGSAAAPAAETGARPTLGQGEALTRVAVFGTGSIGSRHLRVLGNLAGVKPVAVPIRPEHRAELAQAGYEVCESLAEAAAQGARLAIIATDTRRHLADAQAALQAGLDVLLEKPMAVDAVQAQAIWRTALQASRRLFVACNLRFDEGLNAFRNWLPRLGRLHAVRVECQSYLPDWRPARPYQQSYSARADEGGVLRDLIHEIDYAGWLFGWPSAVQARIGNTGRLGIAADEAADLLWETEAGAAVSVRLDYLTRPTRRRMRADGALGTLEWDAIAGRVTLSTVNESEQTAISTQDRDAAYLAQARAFVQSGSAAPDLRLAAGEEGVRALAICDAARRSSLQAHEGKVAYP
jgi:predicted dehydrogenase